MRLPKPRLWEQIKRSLFRHQTPLASQLSVAHVNPDTCATLQMTGSQTSLCHRTPHSRHTVIPLSARLRSAEVRPGNSRHQCNDRTRVAPRRLPAVGLVAAIGGLMHAQMELGRARACSHVLWLAWILRRCVATRFTSDSARFVCQRFAESLPDCCASPQNPGAYRILLDTEPRPDRDRIHAKSLSGVLRRGHFGGVRGS